MLTSLLIGGAIACAAATAYYDAALQKHRVAEVPRLAFSFVPIRWFVPELYTSTGQSLRRRAIVTCAAMVALGLLAILSSDDGL